MKWKHLFQYHILDRGLDYYNSGHVSIEEISETQILATVAGSEYYEVCINLKNGEIASMHCDCPYADGGSHCKHMAAVLYATAQEYEAISTSPQPKKALAEAIAALPREMLEQLLLEQGKKNAKLSEHIILIATKKLPKNYQSVWHAEISAILESDYSDYMDFDEAYDRFCDLSAYLDEKAEGLRKSGLLWEAFELVDIVYRTITDMEEFDWDTIFDEMIGTCNAWWSKLYDLGGSQIDKVVGLLMLGKMHKCHQQRDNATTRIITTQAIQLITLYGGGICIATPSAIRTHGIYMSIKQNSRLLIIPQATCPHIISFSQRSKTQCF